MAELPPTRVVITIYRIIHFNSMQRITLSWLHGHPGGGITLHGLQFLLDNTPHLGVVVKERPGSRVLIPDAERFGLFELIGILREIRANSELIEIV